jgi:hypothetical protein
MSEPTSEGECYLGVLKKSSNPECIIKNFVDSIILSNDFNINSQGELLSIKDVPLKKLSVKLLRKVCACSRVSGYKNQSKESTLGLIAKLLKRQTLSQLTYKSPSTTGHDGDCNVDEVDDNDNVAEDFFTSCDDDDCRIEDHDKEAPTTAPGAVPTRAITIVQQPALVVEIDTVGTEPPASKNRKRLEDQKRCLLVSHFGPTLLHAWVRIFGSSMLTCVNKISIAL